MKRQRQAPESIEKARELRHNSTKPEAILWGVIRVTNDDVLGDLEAVARYIAREAGIELA